MARALRDRAGIPGDYSEVRQAGRAGAPRSIWDRSKAELRTRQVRRLGQQLTQQRQRSAHGPAAMAEAMLLGVGQLGHRLAPARHQEDRIIAEAIGAGWRVRHPTATRSSPPVHLAIGRLDRQHRAVLAATLLDRQASDLLDDQRVLYPVVSAAPARRTH